MESCHVTIGSFEIIETFRNAMDLQGEWSPCKHGFNARVIAYVKDEKGNILTKTTILISIVSCEVLGLTTPFVGACWGHAMSTCQYATNDSNVCADLISISIKET